MPQPTKRNNKQNQKHGKKPQIRKKDVRAKKEAARKIQKKFGPEVANMNRDDLKYLKNITTQEIKKERFREKEKKLFGDISKVQIRSPLTAGKYAYAFDFYSLFMAIQAMIDYYSTRTSLFNRSSGVTPAEFRIYCVAATLTYLQRVGKVIGPLSNKVPQPASTTLIPQPLFKLLEYFQPYTKNGISQSMEYVYSSDWQSTFDFCGSGDGLTFDAYGAPAPAPFDYTGFMNTLVFAQTTITQTSPPTPTVPAGGTNFDKRAFPTPIYFSDWMSTSGNLSLVAGAIENNNINSKPITDLPGMKPGSVQQAPDGSAYCCKAGDSIPANLATDMPTAYGGLLSVHEDYDCDMWYLTGLFRQNTTVPGTITGSLTTPIYNFNRYYGNTKKPIPWYCQAFYVFVFLCDNCDNFYKGKAKHLTLNGARLKTFFPNVRVVTPYDFVTQIWDAYRTIQMDQTEAVQKYASNGASNNPALVATTGGQANETRSMTNWTLLMSVCFLALYRRFNEQQVVPANSPLQYHDAQSETLMPQLTWVDKTAANADIPKNVAKAIDNLGVVIKSGRLYIPATLFTLEGTAQTYPYPSNQLVGPIAWSAIGYTKEVANTYKLPALMAINVGSAPSSQAVPAAVKLDGLLLDLAFAQKYSGYDTTIDVLYPIMLSGEFIQKYQEQLTSFILGGNPVNTIEKNLSKPTFPKMGSITSMMTEVVVNVGAPQVDNVVPGNLQIAGPSNQVLSQLVIVRLPVVTVSSVSLLSPNRAMETLFNSWCTMFNQGATQPMANLKFTNANTFAILSSAPLPTIQQPVASGSYNATTIAGNSLNSALSKLSSNLLKPDSEFAKNKAKIDAKMVGIGGIVPTRYAKALQKVNDNPAFDAELQKLEKAVFGEAAWRTTITPSQMGKMGKRMPPGVAQNFAAIDSHSDITSCDNAPTDVGNSTPKVLEMKCDGHRLKNFGNFCKSALKTTGDIAKTAADTIDSVGRATAAIGNIVP